MKPTALVVIAATLAATLPCFGADLIAWGPAVNGIRLGTSFDLASSEIKLRVFLQNVGSLTQQIVIGDRVAKGTAVNFTFIATTPDGREHEGFEINSFTPMAALVQPEVVRLYAGATHERQFALKKIICTENPGDITFDTLVKQRSSVRVSLETDAKSGEWAGLSRPWIGKIVSSKLAPPN